MKRFSKETTAAERAETSTATIVVMTKELYMNNDKKVARYDNTTAATFQKLQCHFTAIPERVKAKFIRQAVWVSVARWLTC